MNNLSEKRSHELKDIAHLGLTSYCRGIFMKPITKVANLVACATILAACVPNEGVTSLSSKQVNYLKAENVVRKHTGDGVCMQCFNSYRTWKENKAFAMSSSGAFGISNAQKTVAAASKNALASCKAQRKKGSDNCKLLMVNDKYLWE